MNPTATRPWAIQTRGLTKTFRSRSRTVVALNDLDLAVPMGGVHGFLGPNGSGKSTTIKILLGLTRASAGQAWLLGRPVPDELPSVIAQVGAIVESPKFFDHFTARLNLLLLTRAAGLPDRRVDEVLAEVGLNDQHKTKFKALSLGMKQRLAIAATLLKQPDLLIFDEPTNGLDPAGIHEVRTTIRRLADQGRTVLLSSHLIAEVEQVADTVSIIAGGRLITSGPVAQLLAAPDPSIRVGLSDPARGAVVLRAAGLHVDQRGRELVVRGASRPEQITELLAAQRLYVSQLVAERIDLEAAYLELTRGTGLRGSWADAMTKDRWQAA